MAEQVKREAQIAKSALPKNAYLMDLTLGKWYPIFDYDTVGCVSFRLCDDVDEKIFVVQKNSFHLAGGNWKVRKVKK